MTKDLERLKEWKREHRHELRLQNRRNAQRLHAKVIDYLGGKCVHCGMVDKRLLQVNHLNDKSTEDLKQPRSFYHKILRGDYPKGELEVRCSNCNILYEYSSGKRVWLADDPSNKKGRKRT